MFRSRKFSGFIKSFQMLWENQIKTWTEFYLTIRKRKPFPVKYNGFWLAYSSLPGNHVTARMFLFQLKLPLAFTFSSSHVGASWPWLLFLVQLLFLTLSCRSTSPLVFHLGWGCMCSHTSLMLLLLPQDLVPLKQGLWFDRLPVLGLQSNRPVGMVVLLSTCSWLLCVCPLVCVLLLSTLLCCMLLGFSHPYLENQGVFVEWQKNHN
jgi:hypothetical protein